MSLRARLTLLYTALVGGILILFGVAVYGYVTITLINRIDENLEVTAEGIYENTSLDESGELSFGTTPELTLPTDVYVQIWDRDLNLVDSNAPWFRQPLDPEEILSSSNIFRDVTVGNVNLRVVTVPLTVGGNRRVGVLQVAQDMVVVDTTQDILKNVLVIGTLLAILFAGMAGWYSTNKGLSPLEDAMDAALQITRADDLSRRIPYKGPAEDEVGQLIAAFNLTLSRLESLFNTQRRFMADVGHELRTPLTVIKGNVGLMRRMGDFDEESLAGIESEVDRLTRMVGDLLLLAQAESGKLPLDKHIVELDTLALEALSQMKILARDKLTLKLGDIDQVLVCADKDRIKQVLVNLIGNAINYTPAGGEVLVGVGKENSQARITIKDSGSGIPTEDLPHIFERFYRGEKSRTRPKEGKGFGLGLSIAYWIIRNHGGRIEVDTVEGKGTTFCVWLPLAEQDCTPSMIVD
ncbi:MAG: sensor histidine kinase [Chloroflexi bacterium]|nr:MAG: sensor histidine kinase [Chloroflexota bacterium]